MSNRLSLSERRRTAAGRIALFCACLLFTMFATGEPLKIRISGLDSEATQNLKIHLGTIERRLAEQPGRLRRRVAKSVEAALQPYGYYEAEFETTLSAKSLRIRITPGARVLLAPPQISVEGEAGSLPQIAALLEKAPFTPGQPLSHATYDDFRELLLRTCDQFGFFDAHYLKSQLRVDLTRREARVILQLDSGPRYRFGPLQIVGSSVRPQLLQQLVPFAEGEEFDNDKVMHFEQRLRDTGYFRSVAVQVEQEPPQLARIMVLGEDMRTSQYEFGVGFSTDSSLRLRANRITPLMNDKGHSLRIESAFSEPQQSVAGVYRIPHRDPLDDVFELSVGMQNERIEDTDSTTATAGLRHALKAFGDWSLTYGASAELERYTVGNETEKNAAYLMPGTSLAHTRLDKGIDPLSGHSYWNAIEFSDETLGSNARFLRWRASGKWLHGFSDRNTTLLTRIELGAIWTDAFDRIPASLRFHTGGDRSIRGYDFDSLGPRDSLGKVIGGRYLSVASLELSRRIKPQWRLAAFVDGGSAFTNKHDDFYQSAGLGLRWLSPIGQVRVDLATPLGDSEHSGVRLHISMGPPL